MDIKNLTIKQAQEGLRNKTFSARKLAEAYLDEAQRKNPNLNAYLEIFDDVLAQADEADKRIKEGTATTLTGIPLAIKDNILIKERIASAASRILEHYSASYDAHVITKLKEAGAVFVGRTNMDEFAMGGSTENSAYGPTKNPHDESRVAGGSSGGSAAVVAADMALGALGSDTGGSIRQPASLCGIVGLKPTYGAVSRRGVMAMGSSLDQIGPFGKTVEDVEIIFNVIRGHDPKDSTSVDTDGADLKTRIGADRKFRIGVPEDFVSGEGINADVLANFRETLDALSRAGHEIVSISLPHAKYSLASYYIVMFAEASTNLARFDGVRYGLHAGGETGIEDYKKTRGAGFGREVRRRIMLGTYVLSAGYYDAYYGKATAVRDLIRRDFTHAFDPSADGVHVIVTPTTPTPAFKIGEKSEDPLSMYLADIFTVPVNLAGVPAISVPSGFVAREGKKLPLGFQIIAPHFLEDTLFALARAVEDNRNI